MTLRTRLICSVVASLLISVAFGGLLIWLTARNSVSNELAAALAVGEQTVQATVDRLPRSTEPRNELLRLIATFDRERHVRAVLRGDGRWEFASTLATEPGDVPAWFLWLVSPEIEAVHVQLPAVDPIFREVVLEPDPRNEVQEVWNSSRESVLGMAAACVLTSILMWWSLGQAVKPFRELAGAFGSIRAGQYQARLNFDGPAELRNLAAAFNHMAEELEASQEQNRRLNEQLITLQERERAELARDLHDEIGPFLLAVNIDAAAIEAADKDGRYAEIPELVASIRDAVGHMQRHVRVALNRLRPVGLQEFGLAKAIDNLLEFWGRRHPEIDFAGRIEIDDAGFGAVLDPTIFRIVQEGLSNALRHGHPSRISITVARATGSEEAISVVVSDNGAGSDRPTPGFGLTSMRERVTAAGGQLTHGNRSGGGFAISAWLPLRMKHQLVAQIADVSS
jgi:two-component system, NarL family, sensor histidine kinase UhpB